MNRKHKGTFAITIITIIAAVLIISLYSNIERAGTGEVVEASDKIEELLMVDLKVDYPKTARETVKVYLDIMECLYGEEVDSDQIESLAEQTLYLFDNSMLELNPLDQYVERLKAELLDYEVKQLVIDSYEIEDSDSISYYFKDDTKYALVKVQINTKDSENRYKTLEEFIMRRDSDGYYKILGWRPTDAELS